MVRNGLSFAHVDGRFAIRYTAAALLIVRQVETALRGCPNQRQIIGSGTGISALFMMSSRMR